MFKTFLNVYWQQINIMIAFEKFQLWKNSVFYFVMYEFEMIVHQHGNCGL